ncbi:MAG: PLD nuclease N-terminal domain-containing protein, partial [Pseudomonadota bacterium]
SASPVSGRASVSRQTASGWTDMIEYLGLWVLVALTLNMWALLSVLGANATIIGKAVWAIVLLALPGIAFIGWFLFGPRRA